jgi:D-arabinose 1-dehydrogenase-like Zn-dependent alcohol dehydrogenase
VKPLHNLRNIRAEENLKTKPRSASKMVKAAVFHETGPPEVLKYEDIGDVSPLEKNEVRTRHVASGVNFVDCYIRQGRADYKPPKLPHILGFEGEGPITAVGEGGLFSRCTSGKNSG